MEAQHGSRPDMMCMCVSVCVKSLVLDFIFDHMHLQVNWNLTGLTRLGGGCLLSLIISIMQLKFKQVHCAAGSEFGFSKDPSYFRM